MQCKTAITSTGCSQITANTSTGKIHITYLMADKQAMKAALPHGSKCISQTNTTQNKISCNTRFGPKAYKTLYNSITVSHQHELATRQGRRLAIKAGCRF